jgi:putative restriction endonuclease
LRFIGLGPATGPSWARNPDAADNRWLLAAFENRIPIIYFLGIAPGCYQAVLPAFISGWDGRALKARVAFGAPDQETLAPPETALERPYALRAVQGGGVIAGLPSPKLAGV